MNQVTPATVDRRIPVLFSGEVERPRPDSAGVLPRPIPFEIAEQVAGARARAARFLVAMPNFEILG